MSYLAFTYKQYDNYGGIRNNFRGTFEEKADLLKCVKGDRYDYLYLEILDTDTLGFEEYKWYSRYVYMDRRKLEDGTWDNDKHWLVNVWYHKPSEWTEFSFRDGGCGFDTEEHKMMYEAGEWMSPDYHRGEEHERSLNK